MNINELFDDLEKLKKEVWYLIKKVIPEIQQLLDSSSLGDLENIKNQISSALSDISNLQEEVSQLDSLVSSNSTDISNLQDAIENFNVSLTSLSSSLSSLNELSSSHSQQLSSINSSISSLQSSVDSLSTQINTVSEIVNNHSGNILSLSSSVGEAKSIANEAKATTQTFSTNLTSLSNTVTNNISRLNSIESSLNELNNTVPSLSNSVSSLTEEINSLSTAIENAKKEDCTIIYDMSSSDSSVNFGYTSGMKGANYISYDFSPFHSIRIYARVFSMSCVKEVPVHNRKLTDITMVGVASNPIIFGILKLLFTIEPLLNKFQVGAFAKYTFSTSSGTFTSEIGSSDNNFYVYRIEGIKK